MNIVRIIRSPDKPVRLINKGGVVTFVTTNASSPEVPADMQALHDQTVAAAGTATERAGVATSASTVATNKATEAGTARDAAVSASTVATNKAAEAGTARDAAISASTVATNKAAETITARDAAVSARQAADGSAGQVATALGQTLTARDQALTARDQAVAAAAGVGTGSPVATAQPSTSDPVHFSTITQFGRKRTVRLLYTGTSIANNALSGARVFLGALYKALGNSGNRTEEFGYLGGGYTEPQNGWRKQRYGGFMLIRLRGESTSTALSFSRFCKRYVLRYSLESDGGSFDLYVDGVKNQTISCQGAQKYGNEVVVLFDRPGQHVFEIRPPATGFAYIETQDFCLDKPGLHVLDASLGGSALAQMVQVSAAVGNQAPSIAVAGSNGGFASNGIDAVYNNTQPNSRPDAVLFTYTVNDAGAGLGVVNAVYKPALAYIVRKTYENNQPLILIIEPGGHYALPSYPQHDAFNAVRKEILSYVDWPHVTIFDWHEQSGLDTTDIDELVRLGNRYYSVDNLTRATAQSNSGWGGDFIHPNDWGNAILSEMMLSRFGLSPLGRQGDELEAILDSERPRTEMVSLSNPPTPYSDPFIKLSGLGRRSVNQVGIAGQYSQVGISLNLLSSQPEPLWQSSHEINYAGQINDEIAQAATSDAYGAYRRYNSGSPLANYVGLHDLGGRATLTLLVGSGQYSVGIRNDQNTQFLTLFAQGRSIPGQFFNGTNQQSSPQVVHLVIDNVPGVVYWTFTGMIYGVALTLTDTAVIAGRRIDQAPFGLPSALLLGDILASLVRPGQHYFEQVNGKSIEKIATDSIVLRPLAAGQNRLYGLYRLRDKTSCDNQLLTLTGNVTLKPYSKQVGGATMLSDSNPQFFVARTAFGASTQGKTYTLVGLSSFVKIQLYAGSANVYLSLRTDGSWQNNGGNDGGAANLMVVNNMGGMPCAFTFTVPDLNRIEWELRVYVAYNADQSGYWHLCEGALATI